MSAKNESALIPVPKVTGRPIPLPGNDVDTDRIIPARFMTAITFDGLGELAFRDARPLRLKAGIVHRVRELFSVLREARVAIVNKNFGCGSSREHAPQALYRWGIKALVGESFADIFFGNCVAMGIPCVIVTEGDAAKLIAAVEKDPAHDMTVDVDARSVSFNGLTVPVTLPEGARTQLLKGTWDATRILVDALPQVKETAAKLPYTRAFAG